MSARGYALYSVCPQFSFFFLFLTHAKLASNHLWGSCVSQEGTLWVRYGTMGWCIYYSPYSGSVDAKRMKISSKPIMAKDMMV